MSQKACIFDLDGVITDTAHYHFLAWRRLAHAVDVGFDAADNERLKGVGRMQSLDYILAKTGRNYSDVEKAALADQKNADYKQLIEAIKPTDLLPGITDAFDWLQDNGWKIGLASASRNAGPVIESLGVTSVFDYVADAAKIPNGKPAPDIFLAVAAAFDLPPAACLGVEDAVSGVTAIKAAGMKAVGIGDPAILSHADIILPTPEGLPEQVFVHF